MRAIIISSSCSRPGEEDSFSLSRSLARFWPEKSSAVRPWKFDFPLLLSQRFFALFSARRSKECMNSSTRGFGFFLRRGLFWRVFLELVADPAACTAHWKFFMTLFEQSCGLEFKEDAVGSRSFFFLSSGRKFFRRCYNESLISTLEKEKLT